MVLFPVLFESIRHKLACVEVARLADHAFSQANEFLLVLEHPVKVDLTHLNSFESTVVFLRNEFLDLI